MAQEDFVDIAVTYTANDFHGIYRGKKYHAPDFDHVITRAKAAGCRKMILTTMNDNGAQQNLEMCRRYAGYCYMTIGIHPYHASEIDEQPDHDPFERLIKLGNDLIEDPSGPLVAFGEIGLDYYYTTRSPKKAQIEAFTRQLDIAITPPFNGLPLFLHARDACDDFIKVISPYIPLLPKKGIVHSFAGTKDEMLKLIQLGFDISVNGVSFHTEEQRDMVRAIPLEHLQLETDAPWCELPFNNEVIKPFLKGASQLPPSRDRKKFVAGQMVKGRNESCTIGHVAMVIAGIKGVSVQEVIDAAWNNSFKLFGLGQRR